MENVEEHLQPWISLAHLMTLTPVIVEETLISVTFFGSLRERRRPFGSRTLQTI